MKFSFRRDLGLQLLALYLLFVGPVVLATVVFDRLASQRLEADVKAADLALARAVAKETNTLAEESLQAVRQLAQYSAVQEADPQGMERLFSTVLSVRPDINLIYRLDKDGEMLYHYPPGPGSTVGWDFSGRTYFQRAQQTHAPLLSEGRISPTTEQPVATAVMPLWDAEGQFQGVVATNIKLQSLSHTISSITAEYPPGETFQIVIIDSAGQTIAHPSPQQLLSSPGPLPQEVITPVLLGQTGSLVGNSTSGEGTLFTYLPVSVAGWGVIVARPTATAFATPRATHQGVLLMIAVFLVVGLFFWLMLTRQVIRPLERLAVFSRSIGLDEPGSQEQREALDQLSLRPDQIGHLSRSLNRMESAIQARLTELSTLLDTSASVVSTLDSSVVLDRILDQVARLMDIHMCAIIALDPSRNVFRVQASRGLSRRYTEQIAISPAEPFSITLRALRSGQPIQVSDTESDPSFTTSRPRAQAEGYRSALAVPLRTQHAQPSALLVYRPEPHQFTQREINLLTSFANHAAMAIENATLFAHSDMRLSEQTRRLEALIQSLQDGLILETLDGRVLYANRRMAELVNLSLEEMSGASAEYLMERLVAQSRQPAEARVAIQAALRGANQRRAEFEQRTNRQSRFLRLHLFDVTDTSGAVIGRGRFVRDVTRNRELDRMKTSLISTVSHELRTPLASIKGYVSTLLAKDVEWDPASQLEFLTIISSETDRLTSLVNDLLDMSRIEAGNLTVSRVPCKLDELIQRAARSAHPEPGERLKIHLPSRMPALYADPQRLESVLRNLIENAAKYAGPQATITISAETRSGQMLVRVEDDGPGIPPEDSERIFESFYRVESGLTRSAAGAGLGLAICQGFVRAHGGEIWLEPRSRGACVAFSLPLRTEPRAEAAEPAVAEGEEGAVSTGV